MSVHRGNENPFLAELIPVAFTHDIVFEAILTLSGIHYAESNNIPVDETTWLHYGQAIQSLKFKLTSFVSGDDTGLMLLVTALLLCTIESLRGGSGANAIQHMKGARHLLTSVLSLPNVNTADALHLFLIEYYSYVSVLSNITLGADSDSWIHEDASLFFPLIAARGGSSSGMMCGNIHELFQLIPQVSSVARKRIEEQNHHGTLSWEVQSSYLSLRQMILAWRSNSDDEEIIVCGKIYQLGLLLYLAVYFEKGHNAAGEAKSNLDQAFESFAELLDALPVDSPSSTTLCWPLVIFGSCARHPPYRNLIRTRMKGMSDHLALTNIREALSLLEVIWESNDENLLHPQGITQIMEKR
ncbi:hypothetical protein VE02_10233 [Pseudogymnoascus sp. 03VT05]|nr:hypothetical protein VE02_10233 [Pseudogymnoascus sp. 03VT05]